MHISNFAKQIMMFSRVLGPVIRREFRHNHLKMIPSNSCFHTFRRNHDCNSFNFKDMKSFSFISAKYEHLNMFSTSFPVQRKQGYKKERYSKHLLINTEPNFGTTLSQKTASRIVEKLDAPSRALLLQALEKGPGSENGEENGDTCKDISVSSDVLWTVFWLQAIPFIGFGFLDNFIMIIAGESIDRTFGVMLAISTMAAAGFGNLVSDICGLASAGYIESVVNRLGMETPHLTVEQAQAPKTRWTVAVGRIIGISIGCIIGMFPLLFIKHEEDHKEEANTQNSSKETHGK